MALPLVAPSACSHIHSRSTDSRLTQYQGFNPYTVFCFGTIQLSCKIMSTVHDAAFKGSLMQKYLQYYGMYWNVSILTSTKAWKEKKLTGYHLICVKPHLTLDDRSDIKTLHLLCSLDLFKQATDCYLDQNRGYLLYNFVHWSRSGCWRKYFFLHELNLSFL